MLLLLSVLLFNIGTVFGISNGAAELDVNASISNRLSACSVNYANVISATRLLVSGSKLSVRQRMAIVYEF